MKPDQLDWKKCVFLKIYSVIEKFRCAAHFHVEVSHAKAYHVYEKFYTITPSVVQSQAVDVLFDHIIVYFNYLLICVHCIFKLSWNHL